MKAFALADSLVIEVYKATRKFPTDELYGLTSQMRRASVSVSANIVEGCARESKKEYIQFLNISFGSLKELGYYIDLSRRLGYLSRDVHARLEKQHEENAKVLTGLIKSLKRLS